MVPIITASVTEWVEKKLIPKISKSLGKSNENVISQISVPENSFFISFVCTLDLDYPSEKESSGNDSESTLKLVIKKCPPDPNLADKLYMNRLFHNEILFYKKVARNNSRFPHCVYTEESNFEDTVIVTKNICDDGYEICPEGFDIPTEYVFAAINEIARMHAITYTMKEREPEKFHEVINEIQESRMFAGEWMQIFVDAIATRPIEWLRKNNCGTEFCDKMEKFLGNGFAEGILPAAKPVEPLATLIHGDFTRNNVFFRKIDGKLEAMLIDFALIRYSSPAIDIATFLYLNCSISDRINQFDNIFKSYHDTLISSLRESDIVNMEKYSYDKFLADYKRRAIFGYLIAIFFAPIIRGCCAVDFENVRKDLNAAARETKLAGGDEMTEFFGKMILELRDTGCLDHLL